MIKQTDNVARLKISTSKIVFFVCSLVICFQAIGQDKGIHFDNNTNWKGILTKARAENKYIFVDCFTTWCGPCKYMSNNIFPMEEIGDFYNARFISVAMQFDSTVNDAENIKARYDDAVFISKEYKIMGYPAFLFFSPDGELVHRKVGCRDAKEFIAIGTAALDPENQYYTQIKKYNAGQRDSTFLNNLVTMALAAFDDSLVKKFSKEPYTTLNEANKNRLKSRLKQIIISEELESVGRWAHLEKWDEKQWNVYSDKLRKTYPLFAEDVLLVFKTRIYQNKSNWNQYTATVIKYAKNTSVSAEELDHCASVIFANCNDNKILNEALQWSKQSFTNQERIDPDFVDTYANLLYKLGRTDEALEWEKKAQKIAIEQGGDESWGQDVINKITKGEKTW